MWARSVGMEGGYPQAAGPPATDDVGDFKVELRAPRAAGDILTEWHRLEARALEPNIFAGPDFLASAATHAEALRDVKVLLLWRDGMLDGVFPLLPATGGFAARDLHVPQIETGCSGAPLVDGQRPEAVLNAACTWLSSRHSTLIFEGLDPEGPFSALLHGFARQSGRRLVRVEPAKGRLRLELQGDIASASGRIAFERASDPAAIRLAVEEFLVIEAQEALTQGRLALIQAPGQANLVRTVTRQLARRRDCEVFTLRIGGAAAAAALVLIEPKRGVIWRAACDPRWPEQPLRRLLNGRISKLLTRRAAIETVFDPAIEARALGSHRLALKPGDRPDSIARRLGERMLRSADSLAIAATRRLRGEKRKPAA